MELLNEIGKIINYKNANLDNDERKSETQIQTIEENLIGEFKNNEYDFTKLCKIILNKDDKKRAIYKFEDFSIEEILCIYIKRLLDVKLKIKYPNRNKYVHSLFDILNAVKDMNDYVIIKFDFKDFFNSISSQYVFEKYLCDLNIEREDYNLIEIFVKQTGMAYAGLNTSNIMCEIISINFDREIRRLFKPYGLIFYKRYIDDGIIICNSYISNDKSLELIKKAIDIIFNDKSINCKNNIRLNMDKYNYIARREMDISKKYDFDFLGYYFEMQLKDNKEDSKTKFKYGITKKKILKYTKKVDLIVKDYIIHGQIELLRNQLKAFACRIVYQVPRYKTLIWKSKGFISNYSELRFHYENLTSETKEFLENVIENTLIKNKLANVYFIDKNNKKTSYNLYYNLIRYKTLLFIENIGIELETLRKMCVSVGINPNNTYDKLVREYLIKIKIGH